MILWDLTSLIYSTSHCFIVPCTPRQNHDGGHRNTWRSQQRKNSRHCTTNVHFIARASSSHKTVAYLHRFRVMHVYDEISGAKTTTMHRPTTTMIDVTLLTVIRYDTADNLLITFSHYVTLVQQELRALACVDMPYQRLFYFYSRHAYRLSMEFTTVLQLCSHKEWHICKPLDRPRPLFILTS